MKNRFKAIPLKCKALFRRLHIKLEKRSAAAILSAIVISSTLGAVTVAAISGAVSNGEPEIELAQSSEDLQGQESILFLAIDDLKNWIGTNKPEGLITPNLDSLVEDSVYLKNAQSSAVWCNPSRVSMWTGLRPTSSGVDRNGKDYKDWRGIMGATDSIASQNYDDQVGSIKTLFQHFDDNDYFVGASGKVMHDDTQQNAEEWDYNYAHDNLFKGGLSKNGITNYPLNGLEEYVSSSPHKLMDWGSVEDIVLTGGGTLEESDIDDNLIAENALAAIDQASESDQPFFISAGFFRPHLPSYVPQRFIDMYLDENGESILPDPTLEELIPYLENDQDDVVVALTTSDFDKQYVLDNPGVWKDYITHYWATTTFVDELIGDLINDLKERDAYDDTTIVLWSDHGYALGEKQVLRKGSLWRESTDIALLVKNAQNTNGGTVAEAPVNTVDIFPTLVEIAGLDMPTDYVRDGRSFARLLEDPEANWPWLTTTDMNLDWFADHNDTNAKVVRSNSEAYIRYFYNDDTPPAQHAEYYRLDEDPNEWINLLSTVHGNPSEYQDDVDRLEPIVIAQGIPSKPPTAVAGNSTVRNVGSVAIELTGTDPNLDYLEITIDSLPDNGTLFQSANGKDKGNKITETGRITNKPGFSAFVIYEPQSFVGNISFEFSVSDGSSDSEPATRSVTSTSTTATNDKFICTPNTVFLTRGDNANTGMLLDRINLSDANPVPENLITSGIIPFRTNAVAYNNADGYIYGIEFNSGISVGDSESYKRLNQIRNDGSVETVLDINAALSDAGYPELASNTEASKKYTRIAAPAADTYNNTYYAVISPSEGKLRHSYLIAIDLSDFTLTSVQEMGYTNYTTPASTEEGTGGPYFGDLAIQSTSGTGYYFDRLAQRFAGVNITNGQVTLFGLDHTNSQEIITGGAAMFTGNGEFYVYGRNDATTSSGQDTLYEVSLEDGSLTVIATGASATIADGASCFDASAPAADIIVCTDSDLLLTRGDNTDTGMLLDIFSINGNNATSENLITSGIIPYRTNAVAYNKQDQYVYGVEFNPAGTLGENDAYKRLIRVKGDGTFAEILDINVALENAGYPELSSINQASTKYTNIAIPAGDIYNNTYYAVLSPSIKKNRKSFLLKINLEDATLTSVTEITYANYTAPASTEQGTGNPFFGDMAINPSTGTGYYFDRLSQRFARLNISTGKVTVFGHDYTDTEEVLNGGAAMFDGDGNFYVYGRNDATESIEQDTLYKVNPTTGTVIIIEVGAAANIVDGAGCV